MSGQSTVRTPYIPEARHAIGPATPQQIASTLGHRGRGWYYGKFPPDQVDFFHITILNQELGGPGTIPVAGSYSIVGNAPVFQATQGMAYLVTDYRFLVFRVEAGGGYALVDKGAVAFSMAFRFLIDGVPIRTDNRIALAQPVTGATVDGYPFVNECPGDPGEFGVMIPILDTQTVDVLVLVNGFPAFDPRFGFEMSGIRMARDVFERVRATI